MDRRQELVQRIRWLVHELSRAPRWKRATQWWDDRIRELEACEGTLKRMKEEQRFTTTEAKPDEPEPDVDPSEVEGSVAYTDEF